MAANRRDVCILQGTNWWNQEWEGTLDRQDLPLMRDWVPWSLEIRVRDADPVRLWAAGQSDHGMLEVGEFELIEISNGIGR